MDEKNLLFFKNCTALVVDDDLSLLEDLSIILKIFFKKVYIASDGEKALELFTSHKIDILFADYVMPKLNGYELSKKIREIDHQVPIVILSSHSDSEKLLNLIDMNLTAYIIKPYDFKDITNSLKKVIENSEKNDLFIHYLDDITIFNKKTKLLHHDGTQIKLSKNEILLLELFINNPDEIISQERIDMVLSPERPLTYQSSKNAIFRFRKKLGKNIIENIQSIGYIYKQK